MQLKGAARLYSMLHEDAPYHDGTFKSWAKEASPSHPFHAADGVTIWTAPWDIRPWDEFLTNKNASPTRPSD